MRKNVASQVVTAQLVSKTDGSNVTSGTTTVYVLGDGGSQASGSGTVTHEGNGCWSYVPTQAETNYDHIAFTFTNTSAVTVTVQTFTTYPQTGDSYTRLGSPAGASIAADLLAIDNFVDDLETRLTAARAGYLDNLATAPPTASQIQAELEENGASVLDTIRDEIQSATYGLSAIKVLVDDLEGRLTSARAGYLDELAAANIPADVDTLLARITALRAGYLDNLSGGAVALASGVNLVDGAITANKIATGAIDADAIATDAVDEITDSIWAEVLDGSYTAKQIIRLMVAALSGKSNGGGTSTHNYRDLADAKNRIQATVDSSGNRTAMTLDVS